MSTQTETVDRAEFNSEHSKQIAAEESLDPTSASARVIFDGAPAENAFTDLRRAFLVGAVATAVPASTA